MILIFSRILFRGKVSAICYAPEKRVLISGGEDSVVICWDMSVPRQEVIFTRFLGFFTP